MEDKKNIENILMALKHQMFKRTAMLTANTVVLSTSTQWMQILLYIHSIFTFPQIYNLLHLTFTVLDGGYESDDESIWSEEDEQTTDIRNYGEHLKLFEGVVYTYVWRTKLSKIIIWLALAIICHSTND